MAGFKIRCELCGEYFEDNIYIRLQRPPELSRICPACARKSFDDRDYGVEGEGFEVGDDD